MISSQESIELLGELRVSRRASDGQEDPNNKASEDQPGTGAAG